MPNLLLLTPIFSQEQILESLILGSYLQNALDKLYTPTDTARNYVFTQGANTLMQAYINYGVGNPGRVRMDPTASPKEDLAAQNVVLMTCLFAQMVNLMLNVDIVFINGNGPVVNSGYASMLALANFMNIPTIYWKDDARHLWGFADNALMLGFMPNFSEYLIEPLQMVQRVYNYSNKGEPCGKFMFPELITRAITEAGARTNPNKLTGHLANMYTLGGKINASAMRMTFLIGLPNSWAKDYPTMYGKMKKILVANQGLLPEIDAAFLISKHVLPSPQPQAAMAFLARQPSAVAASGNPNKVHQAPVSLVPQPPMQSTATTAMMAHLAAPSRMNRQCR